MRELSRGFLTFREARQSYKSELSNGFDFEPLNDAEEIELKELVSLIDQSKNKRRFPNFTKQKLSDEKLNRYRSLLRRDQGLSYTLFVRLATPASDAPLSPGILKSEFLDTSTGETFLLPATFWKCPAGDNSRKGIDCKFILGGENRWGRPIIRRADLDDLFKQPKLAASEKDSQNKKLNSDISVPKSTSSIANVKRHAAAFMASDEAKVYRRDDLQKHLKRSLGLTETQFETYLADFRDEWPWISDGGRISSENEKIKRDQMANFYEQEIKPNPPF